QGGRWPAATRAATSAAISARSSRARAMPSTTIVSRGGDVTAAQHNPRARPWGAGSGGGALLLRAARGRGLGLGGRLRLALGLGGGGLALAVAVLAAAGPGARIEVGVPAAALQHEAGARDQAPHLPRPALRARLHRILGDALLALELVAALLAQVLVDRHGSRLRSQLASSSGPGI